MRRGVGIALVSAQTPASRLKQSQRVHDALGASTSFSPAACKAALQQPWVWPPRGPTVAEQPIPIAPYRGRLGDGSHTPQRKDDRFQGRAVRRRRDPGAALCLPPATLEQAFSLESQSPVSSFTESQFSFNNAH